MHIYIPTPKITLEKVTTAAALSSAVSVVLTAAAIIGGLVSAVRNEVKKS